MPSELKTLKLTELSLVDTPANPLAMAPIFKRDTSNEGDNMSEVIKMSDEMDKKIKAYMKEKGCDRAAAEAAMTKAFDEVERLTKALIENEFVIKSDAVEKKTVEEQIEFDGEMVNKSAIPAPVLKKLEAMEKAEKETAIAKKASETFPNFSIEVAKALVAKDFSDEVLQALKAADSLFEAQMTEKGKVEVDGDMSDSQSKMDALVAEYSKAHSVNKFAAFAEVSKTAEGKALINKIYKEQKED